MEKIRILHLIEDLSRGGAQRRLLNDVRYLDAAAFENRIAYLFARTELTQDFDSLNIPQLFLGKSAVKRFFALKKILADYKPHIVHSQLFFANVLARIALAGNRDSTLVSTLQYPDYDRDCNAGVYSLKRKSIDRATRMLLSLIHI